MTSQSWQPMTADGSVLALKYSFGPGTANTLAARTDDGSWLVVSPSAKSPPEVMEELAKQGPVRALLAPNGFHHLGQAAWRARFPEATSYAPPGALQRLNKKAASIPFRPVDELSSKLPSNMAIFMPEGLKAPDLLFRVTTPGGTVWFGGDLLSNTNPAEVPLPARLVFGLLGGGTGYRVNRMVGLFYLKDRKAFEASVLAAFEQAPPSAIVPAHGDPVRDDAMAKSRAILH